MHNDDDFDIIDSPLTQSVEIDGHVLRIEIYRGPDKPWILEIVDAQGSSTVWDEGFDTDHAALAAALAAIREQGVESFLTEPEHTPDAAAPAAAPLPSRAPVQAAGDLFAPLEDDELDALDRFLLDLDTEDGMTMDMLDGFLHAIVIGPETVMPSLWLARVWGRPPGELLPPAQNPDEASRVLGWVMRHHNTIVSDFEAVPPMVLPMWPVRHMGSGPDDREYEDAEMWAHGFVEGVKLTQAAWQPLLDDPQASRWYRPIALLGADGFSPDQEALIRTPAQREALAEQIPGCLLRMHAYWLQLRQPAHAGPAAQRLSTKVGRNAPCPCGSGRKFKKCCGAATAPH